MTQHVPLPTRDYSILTPRMLRTIQRRAQPPQPDYEAEAEKKRRDDQHKATKQLVSAWPNTIARSRIDRQTRLQREKEAEEKRKVAIDEEEKKIQKLKRQAQLAEAKKAMFMERPEVRAVNSQLLLNEVVLERQEQIALKEKIKVNEMKKQIREDEAYRKRYQEMIDKEERVKRERRLKAIKVAEGFRRQRAEKIEMEQQQREEDITDEYLIAQHMKKELIDEQRANEAKKWKAKEEMEENKRRNDYLITFKEKQKELEELEDKRIRALAEQEMDEADRRRAAEIKRKNDRLAARQGLIDRETKRQAAEKKEQEDFLDKQLREQFAKDSREVQQITARRQQHRDERRKEFLETMALKATKEKEKKQKTKKRVYPFDGNTKYEDEMRERDFEKQRNLKGLQQFQLQQAQDKKERDNAYKEKEKLDFNYAIQKDQEELLRVQDYAYQMLKKAQEFDDEYDDVIY